MLSKLEEALGKLGSNTKEYRTYEKEFYEKFIKAHNDPVLRGIAQKKPLLIIPPKTDAFYVASLCYTGRGLELRRKENKRAAGDIYFSDNVQYPFEEKEGLLVVKIPREYELFEIFPHITPEKLEHELIKAIESLPVYNSTKSYWR